MPLLIICSHCNHAVPTGGASAQRRVCPHCSRSLDTTVVDAAENRRGQQKRRTRLVMTDPVEAKPPVAEPPPAPEPVEVPLSESDAVPTSSALAVDPTAGTGEVLWKPLGRGAALIRAGFVIEWVAVSVFVAVLGAILYLLAPDPRVPAGLRANAFHQEFRALGPPLVLLLASGVLIGAVLVAAGRVFQARAPWDLPSGRGFWVTASCELIHTLCALAFAWFALASYLNLDPTFGGRTAGTVLPLPVLVLGLASRLVADLATVVNFGFASAALPSDALRRRTAAVAVAFALFGTGCACIIAAGTAVGAVGDLVPTGEAADVTHFVVPGGLGYAGFTVYMLLGGALQRAARRATRVREN